MRRSSLLAARMRNPASHAASGASRRRLLCTSRKGPAQEPWALPFAVDREGATSAFASWRAQAGGEARYSVKRLFPKFVPFYVFGSDRLVGNFTGVLEYTSTTSYTDADGKTRSKRVTDEYERTGITFLGKRPMGADQPMRSAIYAGFEYRAKFVSGAVLPGISESVLSRAVRLNDAFAPESIGVEAFAMKPSFAFDKALKHTREFAEAEARRTLGSDECRRMKYTRRTMRHSLFDVFLGSDVACPAEDWTQPSRSYIEDVRYNVEGARLHERGVIFLPVWVVEYTFGGTPYRCFISGLDGHASGLTHLLTGDAIFQGGVYGAVGGLLGAGLFKMPPLIPAGVVFGVAVGYLTALSRQGSWDDEGRKRQRDKEANFAWGAQRFWQDEVKRVLDGASRSRFRQRAQESQRQQEQRQYQRQQEGSRARHGDTTHASSTRSDDWRAMDDYALLGLQRTPPPSPSEIASSFRRQAMKWHPDHNQDKSDADRMECEERFKAINSAHGRLRREAKAARGG